jgi:hypothetical protein
MTLIELRDGQRAPRPLAKNLPEPSYWVLQPGSRHRFETVERERVRRRNHELIAEEGECAEIRLAERSPVGLDDGANRSACAVE